MRLRWRCLHGIATSRDAFNDEPGVAAIVRQAGISPKEGPVAADVNLAELYRFAELASVGCANVHDNVSLGMSGCRILTAIACHAPIGADLHPDAVEKVFITAPDSVVVGKLARAVIHLSSKLGQHHMPAAMTWAGAAIPALYRPDLDEAPDLCRILRNILQQFSLTFRQNSRIVALQQQLPTFSMEREITARLLRPDALLFDVERSLGGTPEEAEPNLGLLIERALPAFKARGLPLSAAHADALRTRIRLKELSYSKQGEQPHDIPAYELENAVTVLEQSFLIIERLTPRLDYRRWSILTFLARTYFLLGNEGRASYCAGHAFAAAAFWPGSQVGSAEVFWLLAEICDDTRAAAFWKKLSGALSIKAAVKIGEAIPAWNRNIAHSTAHGLAQVSDVLAGQGRFGEALNFWRPGNVVHRVEQLGLPDWTRAEAEVELRLGKAVVRWLEAIEPEQDCALTDLLCCLASVNQALDAGPTQIREAPPYNLEDLARELAAASAELPPSIGLAYHRLPMIARDDASFSVVAAQGGAASHDSVALPQAFWGSLRYAFAELSTHPLNEEAHKGTLQQKARARRSFEDVAYLLAEPLRDRFSGNASLVLTRAEGVLRFLPLAGLGISRPLLLDFAISEWPRHLPERPRSQAPPRLALLGVAKHALHGHADLESIAEEVEELIRLFPNSPAVYLDQAADRRGLTALLDQDASVLHIASHLRVNYADPAASLLLLGDGSEARLGEITVRDLSRYDLITLASCSSGVPGGYELRSPADLLLDAGAGAVLSTRWPAPDMPTAMLMVRFYEQLLGPDHPTKAEALRRAQLSIRGEMVHPYYWAGFYLSGDWRPLVSPSL